MAEGLTADQVRFYRDNGYLAPLPAVSEVAAARLRQNYEAFGRTRPADARWAFRTKPHLLFPWLAELGVEDTILDAVESLIGRDILARHLTGLAAFTDGNRLGSELTHPVDHRPLGLCRLPLTSSQHHPQPGGAVAWILTNQGRGELWKLAPQATDRLAEQPAAGG